MQSIPRWSFSRLDNAGCPLRCKLQYIDRIKEPDRGEPPPGLTEWHNDRGTRIHKENELCVADHTDIPVESKGFTKELRVLQHLHSRDVVTLEEIWTFDRDWCDGGDYQKFQWWCAVIADVTVRFNPQELLIIDWKTGKRAWNEVKHAEQMQFYALAAFLKYEELQQIVTELYYVDEDVLVQHTHRRARMNTYYRTWNTKGVQFTRERPAWPAVPSRGNCFFCPYKQGNVGKPEWGVKGLSMCDRNVEGGW